MKGWKLSGFSVTALIVAGVFLVAGGLAFLSQVTPRSVLAQQPLAPEAPAVGQAITDSSDPVSVKIDEDGYTVWTYEYPDTWCVMYSRIRWPFDLGAQDPTDLSETSLRLTFSERQYFPGPGGEALYSDPTWAVALNGDPGPWTEGAFTGEWNIIGAIATEPTWPYAVPVEQEIVFDYSELIDGENNLWFQQQDFCDCASISDCACTCYELHQLQLRARVKLGVKSVAPEPDARHVPVAQNTSPEPETRRASVEQTADSEIRVTFTTLVSEATVNEQTFQVYYLDNEQQPVYVAGYPQKLSDVEYAFVPDVPLKDGVRYQVHLWGETDARAENYDQWVKDLSGGPLEVGRHWSFWTLPQLQVDLEPVQVLEDETLIAYKPTALRVFLSSTNLHPDVWYRDLWEYVEVEDIQLTWRSSSGSHAGTVSWRDGGSDWHFELTSETARRYRLNDKFKRQASQDSVNYYGFVPEETGTYWVRAAVTVVDSHGEEQSFTTLVMPDVIQTRWLNLHARALAVGADYGKTGTDDLSAALMGNRSGVQAIYPVPNVRLAQRARAVPYYDPIASAVWSSAPAGDYQLLKALLEMSALCATTSDCDLMIGFVPMSWLGDIGLTSPRQAWSGMLVQNSYSDFFRFVVAHEGGHLYGFEHDTYEGGQGYDVRRRTDRRISTAWMPPHTQRTLNQINSFMNVDPIESPPPERLWIEWRNYGALRTALSTATASQALRQATTSDPLLLVTGVITPATGAVDLDPWYQIEAGDWQAPTPGPYRLLFLDEAGQEIAGYTQSFTVATTLQPAGSASWDLPPNAPAPFALKVPYPAATARVQIRRTADDALLAERTLSASAPTVSITPPVSATWTGGQTIAWETDPGESRYFIVQVSTDNGATWVAQAIHLPVTTYTLETAGLPNTTQALVRVIATDGLNTASDTAGPFTIDNPPSVDYVSPAPDAVHVSVDQPLYAGFRDPMDPTTIHSGTFTLSGGPYGSVPGHISYDAETREATFIPHVRLAYNTPYTAHVSAALYTLDGSPLAEGATWRFTTEADYTPPRPRLFSPPHGARRVPRNTAIAVAWDRALDPGSLTPVHFQVAERHGRPVSGNVTYDSAAKATTFTPAAPLAPYTTYVVTLTAGISDTQGNATAEPTVWSFSTGDAAPGLALSGSYADSGVDADGDGLYEQLVIRVGVQVTATGGYALRGTLTDATGDEIAWDYVTPTLTAGVHFLDLAFDGAAIGGCGVDGPYTLTDLTLAYMGGTLPQVLASASQQDAYRTFAYAAERFPSPLHFGGLPDVWLLPGTTFLEAFNVHDYANHASLASDRLSYTVMLDTQPAAGVDLQPLGAVHVSPEPYWEGRTRVTVRASDGVHAAQDTFEVAIGWPHALYLPLVMREDTGQTATAHNAQITLLDDDFESETLGWRLYSWISTPPYGPGGWYWWDARDCRASSGQYSAWSYGGNEDGERLSCGAEYPNTLTSIMYKAMPVNLKYVTQGQYTAKVWTDLAPGAQVCLNVSVVESNSCEGDWGPIGDYYGVCRSGQTDGWEDLTLDLADVPTLGNVLGEEHVCLAVNFWGGESGTRPEGAYVDDASLQICPQGLTEYCALSSTIVTQTRASVPGNIGGYPGEIGEVALAVDASGRVHALWTGKLNPSFNDYVFYSHSADGMNWTPYQILNYWYGREPRIAVDDVHGRVHLAYGSQDGVVHHTVVAGAASDPIVVAPQRHYYLPGQQFASGGVAWPSLAVAEETGYAYLLWREAYYAHMDYVYSLRYRTWHAYWDGERWSAPLREISDGDTQFSTIAAAPDGRAMMAWFQRWAQSSGDGTGPGDPIVARTAYGTEPGSFPLRQATHDPYPEPERDESILLAYAGGADVFVLASDHAMWPGHSRVYRYLWQDGVWSEPLSVAENTANWGAPLHVGAATDTPLIRYVYRDDGVLKTRTETNGVLGPVQTIADYLGTRGYSGAPLTCFTDAAGGLHMVINGEKNGVTGFYYVKP